MFMRLRGMAYKAILLSMLVSLVGVTVALAAGGDLDTTFGTGGAVLTDFGASWNDELSALTLQNDGKILAVGVVFDPADPEAASRDITIARYTDAGDPDTSFDGDGQLVLDLSGAEEAKDVAMAAQRRFVVSGNHCEVGGGNCDVIVGRGLEDGSGPDPTFNEGAPRYIDYQGGDNQTVGGLAVTPSGKIVIAGFMWNGTDADFAVYQLKANGKMDKNFSGDGRQRFGFGAGRHDMASDLVLQPDGKIVVVGTSCDASHHSCKLAVARLNSNGSLDTTFSMDGRLMTAMGDTAVAMAVAMGPGNKITIAGASGPEAGYPSMTVVRYKSNGDLDRSFSGDGKQVIDWGVFALATDLVVYGTGKVVLAGYGGDPELNLEMAMVRLKASGGMDDTFGDGGKVVAYVPDHQQLHALVRQPDGMYVVGGYVDTLATAEDFALLRVLP